MAGSYFAAPYQVFFEDTMAYGTHHYLTNLRFQCVGRETLLFDVLPELNPAIRTQLDSLVLLTREGYTRNIAPVHLGERVGILMTQEERSRSTLRLCFRVVREDGQPVCCGYQTIVFVDKQSYEVAPIPAALATFMDEHQELTEVLTSPSFAERCHLGGKHVRELFGDALCSLGTTIAKQRGPSGIVSDAAPAEQILKPHADTLPGMSQGFLFPGQGSYDAKLLHELFASRPEKASYFAHADRIVREHWGHGFLPLVQSATDEERDAHHRGCPELDQLGIFLGAVIVAELLLERGVRADVLIGHSFGELAALCVGGAYDVPTGLEIVVARVNALRDAAYGDGAMLAVSATPERTGELLAAIGVPEVDMAGVNHPKQVVISGPRKAIERVAAELPRFGAMGTPLKSRHPFHSRMLTRASAIFRDALRGRRYGALRTPVYSPILGGLYSMELDVPSVLSSHFIRPFDFRLSVERLRAAGVRTFIECGAGETLSRIVRKNIADAPANVAEATVPPGTSASDGVARIVATYGPPVPAVAEPTEPVVALPNGRVAHAAPEPVAIVGIGCVVPAAKDADELWRNVNEGVSGIADLTTMDSTLAEDFLSSGDVVPDKAYSLLAGIVRSIEPDAQSPYAQEEFVTLTRAQRLLANALSQCARDAKILTTQGNRSHCLLGSTADGIKEYDEALALKLARRALASLDEPAPLKAAMASALDDIVELNGGDPELLAPHAEYAAVAQRVLGSAVVTRLLDSACASSLYAIDAALKMLGDRSSDLVIAGGVFSPGPGINVLFGQFKGLSATGCFPFDSRADGVIFGEGAAVVALKRLPDAIAAGDRIHAVIRGVGLASDGKSASVNVPRSEGQVLAMRRAYEKTGIDTNTIQYIEAHATSTTVGDATEFESLRVAFGNRRRDLPRIWLESVKALTGHTGWVAGATSVIKVCRALAARQIPFQHNFNTAHPAFRLADSPFVIPTTVAAWTPNVPGEPRRAGINGFGFGGTNAHLVLEEYDPAYHGKLCARLPAQSRQKEPLVVTAIGTLFPAADGGAAAEPNGARRFDRRALRLPGKKRLLPDVTEHMDVGQYLAAMAAERALGAMPDWESFRDRIGVVLGATAKTPHGAAATSRLFVDRLRRVLGRLRSDTSLGDADFTRLRDSLLEAMSRAAAASNPYTLIGFMPNVVTGRVANLFDLKGANVVVDAGAASLPAALETARALLEAGDCEVVLAGAEQVVPLILRHPENEVLPDGICMVALTTAHVAAMRGLPILARMETAAGGEQIRVLPPNDAPTSATTHSVGANAVSQGAATLSGLLELTHALHEAAAGRVATVGFDRAPQTKARPARSSASTARRTTRARRRSSIMGRLSGSVDDATVEAALIAAEEPVGFFTPGRFATPSPNERAHLPRAPLYLIDQAQLATTLRRGGLLESARATLVVPQTIDVPGAFVIDLRSEDTIRGSLAALDCSRYDAIIAVKDLGRSAGDSLLDPRQPTSSLLDLLFAVARHAYPRVQRGEMSVGTICLNAVVGTEVHPYTGLVAGFVKSLARELPAAACKSLITDGADPGLALNRLAVEFAAGGASPVEVCYEGTTREIFRLVPISPVTVDTRPYVDAKSVVIATGGGRGVTALLVEELLERFGCTVILVGRTDPASIPGHVLEMSADQFRAYEPEFYREMASRDRTLKPAAMKKLFQSYAAGREIADVMRRLASRRGQAQYMSADVSNAAEVDELVARVMARYGRVDLVMHGAGVQTSTRLDNRKLADFRRTLETKVAGLRNLYTSCRRHVDGDVHFHLLTSAFSYIGNDGQPDYGAANEAMNRLAQYMAAAGTGSHWTSLAWLAWDGIGMTRGTEYAVLVTERGLHGITADEGRSLFATLMRGRPSAAANILLTNAERRLLEVDVAEATPAAEVLVSGPATIAGPTWRLDTSNAPYLREHLVNGTPTVPGTFELALAIEAAKTIRPDRNVAAAENLVLSRFVKVPEGQAVELRSVAQILTSNSRTTVLRVRLLSDFVHKSGAVLQKDIVHFEVDVRLTSVAESCEGPTHAVSSFAGHHATDPYLEPGAPVRLSGTFACLHDIVIGERRRRARFRLTRADFVATLRGFPIPPVLLDAMLRLTVVDADGPGTAPVFVPERIERVRVAHGLNEQQLADDVNDVFLVAAAPELDGELLSVRWVQAIDGAGRTLALIEFGTARRMGVQQLRDVTARPSRQRTSISLTALR